jgi:hypothetical protein
MHEQPLYTESEIARVVGYARVKDAPSERRGRKAKTPRRRALRLRAAMPRLSFA